MSTPEKNTPSAGTHHFMLFHPQARRAYRMAADNEQIYTAYLENPQHILAFQRRWKPELESVCVDIITEQLLISIALACPSNGQSDYCWLKPSLRTTLSKRIDPQYLIGSEREKYSLRGIFALNLPVLRSLTGQLDLTVNHFSDPVFNFRMVTLMLASYIEAYRKKHERDPDPVNLALISQYSDFTQNLGNEFGINYYDQFLPKFIAYYNTYNILQTHQQQTQETQQNGTEN